MRETPSDQEDTAEPRTRSHLRRSMVITIAMAVLGGAVFAQAQGPWIVVGPLPIAKAQPSAAPPAIPDIIVPTTEGPCQLAGGSFPYGGPSCISAGAVMGTAYPVLWYDHCGLWPWTPFDGRTFYVSAVDPSEVDSGLVGKYSNFIPGTMTLTSTHSAIFRDLATDRLVGFQDTPPGEPGVAYPYDLDLYPGWQSVDTAFAGRLWTSGHIPSTSTAAAAGSTEAHTVLSGTFTMADARHAVFRSDNRGDLPFSIATPLCA